MQSTRDNLMNEPVMGSSLDGWVERVKKMEQTLQEVSDRIHNAPIRAVGDHWSSEYTIGDREWQELSEELLEIIARDCGITPTP
jgi:hypothetical protein